MLESNELNFEQFVELMNLQIKVASLASRKIVAAIMGVTGDGKSTLLNYLFGCRYERIPLERGDYGAELLSGQPVCETSAAMQSHTLFPQVLPAEDSPTPYHFCDLPGFDDTREPATSTCMAAAPYILGETLKNSRGEIKALVWVLSAQLGRGENVRKILGYFNNIVNRDINKLLRSLVIVVNKGNEVTNSKGFIKALEAVVKGAEVGRFNFDEITLLNNIISHVREGAIPLVVANIFDEGQSALLIKKAIANKTPVAPDVFDFTRYCENLKKFNNDLIAVATEYVQTYHANLECVGTINTCKRKN